MFDGTYWCYSAYCDESSCGCYGNISQNKEPYRWICQTEILWNTVIKESYRIYFIVRYPPSWIPQ